MMGVPDELLPEMPQIPSVEEKEYYYIVIDNDYRLVVMGAYDTPEIAYRIGYATLNEPFDVRPLKTRDMKRATAHFKQERLMRTSNLDLALRRAKHQ